MNTNRVFLLMIVGIAFCGFARADALPPVDQILSDLGLQATTQPAESPEENAANAGAWQKLFEAYKAEMNTLAPGPAGQRWVQLLDALLAIDPATRQHDGLASVSDMIKLVPPPASWDAIRAEADVLVQAAKPGGRRQWLVRLLGDLLVNDRVAAFDALDAVWKPARSGNAPDLVEVEKIEILRDEQAGFLVRCTEDSVVQAPG